MSACVPHQRTDTSMAAAEHHCPACTHMVHICRCQMDPEPMLSVLSVMSRLSAADVFTPSELHSSNIYFDDVQSLQVYDCYISTRPRALLMTQRYSSGCAPNLLREAIAFITTAPPPSPFAFIHPGIYIPCYLIPEPFFCRCPSMRKVAETLPSYNSGDSFHVTCAA